MFRTLLEKEINEIIRTKKFLISFVFYSILILLTFYVGANSYLVSKYQYDAAVDENIRSMEGIVDWRMIEHTIFLPPQPLAYLVSGISNDIGRNISIKGRGEIIPVDSKYNEDPIYAAFRFLDLNFLFQVILSLFAILLTYNAVNGEKELGTLRLIFSNSVPRDKYILAKISGAFIAITIPLLIPFLLGSLVLVITGVPMESNDWLKLGLIIFTGFIFYAAFLTLSVFVSTITTKSSNSFLFLLVTWVVVILVIPRASVLIAGNSVDVPSVDEINSKKSAYAIQTMDENINKMKSFQPKDVSNVMNEFGKFMEEIGEDREEKLNSYYEKLEQERFNRQKVQADLSFLISRLSPASTFQFAATSISGTSLDLINSYKEQAKEYQKIFANFQIEKTGGTSTSGMQMVVRNSDEAEEINPAELPKFQLNSPTFAKILSDSIIDIGLLVIFNILFFAGSIVSFIKFDLR